MPSALRGNEAIASLSDNSDIKSNKLNRLGGLKMTEEDFVITKEEAINFIKDLKEKRKKLWCKSSKLWNKAQQDILKKIFNITEDELK